MVDSIHPPLKPAEGIAPSGAVSPVLLSGELLRSIPGRVSREGLAGRDTAEISRTARLRAAQARAMQARKEAQPGQRRSRQVRNEELFAGALYVAGWSSRGEPLPLPAVALPRSVEAQCQAAESAALALRAWRELAGSLEAEWEDWTEIPRFVDCWI
jgi:hypothetical protein